MKRKYLFLILFFASAFVGISCHEAQTSRQSSQAPAPSVQAPKLSISDLAERAALRHGINPKLVTALIKAESNFRVLALSKAGAVGLMQIMPQNAKSCGIDPERLLVPEDNISCGTQLLAANLREQKNDVVKAIEAYNGGPRCIGKCKESISHAKKVLEIFSRDLSL